MLNVIADIMLGLGALAAAAYCFVLARRLGRLSGLDQDLGGAIAVLSTQVDEMTKVLGKAQTAAKESSGKLEGLTTRAESVAGQLEVLLAALHDVTSQEDEMPPQPAAPPASDDNATLFQSHRRAPSEQSQNPELS